MRNLMLIAAAALAAAAPGRTQAPADLSIASGEMVVVRIGDDGGLTLVRRGPAPPMAPYARAEMEAMAKVTVPAGTKAPAVGFRSPGARAIPIAPDEVALALYDAPARTPHDSLLAIENGYGRGFVYRAVMRRGERSAATDVCLVMPGKRGFEYWPFQMDRIDLSQLRLVPWKPGDAVPCA